jgi:ribosome-associated toxin RatA of RatAB toxin-antitoxin module
MSMKRRTLLIRTGAAAVLALLEAARPVLADQDAVIAPAATAAIPGRGPEDVQRRKGDDYPIFTIKARIVANAGLPRAWQVLTDYDRLAEFVPDLTSSRVIARDGRESIVSQEGFGQFLFFKQQIHLRVRVVEKPLSAIAVTLIKGNMHEYRADWTLAAIDPETTQIDYNATIAPKFYIPSLFGAALMRSDLRNMLAAVVLEIEKEKGKGKGSEKEKPAK